MRDITVVHHVIGDNYRRSASGYGCRATRELVLAMCAVWRWMGAALRGILGDVGTTKRKS